MKIRYNKYTKENIHEARTTLMYTDRMHNKLDISFNRFKVTNGPYYVYEFSDGVYSDRYQLSISWFSKVYIILFISEKEHIDI
jgi:hypothetical protein